jgi:hypothetical protein
MVHWWGGASSIWSLASSFQLDHHVLCPVLFSAWSLASPFQFDHHVLCPIQYMESGQTLPADHHFLCPIQWMKSGQPVSSSWTSCPMSCSVHGVWPVSPFLLDHHVLCAVQCMESGQSVPSCSTIMSCVLFSAWSLASQSLPARPSCPMAYVLPIAGSESTGGPRER